jgi:outer membrane receptor protein involved in Fe transport
MIKRLLLILLFTIPFIAPIYSGTTGKLSGTVKDADTGEPIPGVNVILEGTTFGAATDVDGYYSINNLPPGSYTVNFSAIGFTRKSFTNVKISVDFTTKLNVELRTETIELQTIVVEAETPLIRKDLTSSQVTVDASQIESLPVESVNQLLTLQAGIVQGAGGELHIRGGRSTEIQYTVNGVSIANPFDNSRTVNIATNAIQELSVVSGTFNAEYGNALSGVVNTITKEGSSQYKGKISAYAGDYLSTRDELFFNIGDFNPVNKSVVEGTVSGPIPSLESKINFFISGRLEQSKGYLYGIREQTIYDSVYRNPLNPNDIKISSTGDGSIVPMNPSRELSATGKLTFKPFKVVKINYDVLFSKSNYKFYSHDNKYNPDAAYNNYEWGLLNSLEVRHALSDRTFYTLRGSYNLNDFKQFLFPLLDGDGNPVDYYPGLQVNGLHANSNYQPDYKSSRAANYTFLSGGTNNGHYYQRSSTAGGKFDVVSQLSKNHEVKLGLMFENHSLDFENFTILRDSTTYIEPTIPELSTANHDLYSKYPLVLAGYIQDKMEFESLIINVGLRYDYFIANSVYSTDIFNPSPNNPDLPPYIDKTKLLAETPAKHQISPRIGVSFPITDNGIIHFSYGHFFQMPPFRNLYTNPDFKYSYAIGTPLFGNANLNPEKTVTYEIGLQQQLLEDLAFNITGYYKDVRDLLAIQQIRISGNETYLKYVNKDYANSKGLTFSLTKRRTPESIIGVTLDYTFAVSEGNETDADAFFLDLSSGRQSEKIPVFLGWDQTHTLNGTVSVGNANDWNVTLVGRLGSGLPYTPQILDQQVFLRTNSGRRPTQARVDLLAEKQFTIQGIGLTIFLKIYNLFDTLNERLVYNDTGRASYTLVQGQGTAEETQKLSDTIPGIHSPGEYFTRPDFYLAPREVNIGMSIEF